MADKVFVQVTHTYDQSRPYVDQDILGFESAKNAFTSTLVIVKPPATIGLYGPWGSGKSWMIEGINQSLKDTGCLTLIFDAWKYRNERNLVLPIMYKLSKDFLLGERDLRKSMKRVIAAVALSTANIGFKLATNGKLGVAEVKEALTIAENGETVFEKYSDQIESLEQHYKEVINGILKLHEKEKLVIFIDNLDRCLPDIVINLLEDLSSFLSIQGVPCIYVLAMDKDIVTGAINRRYSDIKGSGYLEKIVQVSLRMPIPRKEDKKAVYYFMKKYEIAKNLKKESQEGDARDKVYKSLERVVSGVFEAGYLINPRRVELIVNKFITLELLSAFNMESDPENVPIALLLLLLTEFHPNVYEALQSSEDIEYLQRIITVAGEQRNNWNDYKNDRDQKWVNYRPKNFVIADAFCDDENFRGILKGFSEIGSTKDFITRMQTVKLKLRLIG